MPFPDCSWVLARNKPVLCCVLVLLLSACTGSGSDQIRRTWYAGVSGNLSVLEPDTTNSETYSLDSGRSSGAGVTLGLDMAERWGAEAHFSQLGTASLIPRASVDYQTVGASVVYYGLADVDTLRYREGFAGFLRGGVNMMMHESDIRLDAEDNFQIIAGIGMDYMLSNRFALRAEMDFHDTDSQAAHLGLLYRFGSTFVEDSQIRAPQPLPSPRPTVVERPRPPVVTAPRVERRPVARPEPRSQRTPATMPTITPTTRPVVTPSVPRRTTTNVQRNLLASGILPGLNFAPGSARLDAAASSVLSRLANELRLRPSAIVELQAYTDGPPGSKAAMNLARARVTVIGRDLISKGVSSNQLRARAFGSTRSRSATGSVGTNARIELLVVRP